VRGLTHRKKQYGKRWKAVKMKLHWEFIKGGRPKKMVPTGALNTG
jgi:hypothetical protein